MIGDLFEPGGWISADDGLLDDFGQGDRNRHVKVDETLRADNFKSKVTLAVEFALETLLDGTGNNTINNLGAANSFVGDVTNIATA